MSLCQIRRFCFLTVVLSLYSAPAQAANPPIPQADFVPDPASIQRVGPAYRYPQAGWIVTHIEGEPYERGYQHGQLLAPEIAEYVKVLAQIRSPKAPEDGWRDMRTMVNALFLRRYDREYLEEMKGIADGAANAGAKFQSRALDFLDVVTINSGIELDFLDANLSATPTGLEGLRFKEPPYSQPRKLPTPHCSAFAANGPATADGKIVFGHITMFMLHQVRHFNIWLDVKPTQGHRVLMQTCPGGIMSGMDYYLNDAGLMVAETTIRQTKFDINGQSMVSRIRKALQYSDSIDESAKILREANNGVYSNEWLLADTKTNEIAMLELGTEKSKLWRSSKNEWFGGTPGFYWGCNNTKDLTVRLETIPSVNGQPANMVFSPSDRDIKWIQLYQKHKGKIGVDFGFEVFTTAPIAAPPSCDAKFTTTDMAKNLKTWALFGPPLGRNWEPTDAERRRYPNVRPLIANDWTTLHGATPKQTGDSVAADLAKLSPEMPDEEKEQEEQTRVYAPAWHGTILPKADADIWLASAFADYEKIVALEKSLKAKSKDGKLKPDDQEKIDLTLFAPRSRYSTAVRRHGKDIALTATRSDHTNDEWYDIATGKGVLLLAELRSLIGSDEFAKMMDDFGNANAGKEVTAAQFQQHAEKAHGKPLREFFDRRLRENGSRTNAKTAWAIDSFAEETHQTLIVYGTVKEKAAQRESAFALQKLIRSWNNITIPIKTDAEVTDADRTGRHLLLVGRPDSNSIAAKCLAELPVQFGPASFVLRDKTYGNPTSAIISVGGNPFNPRYSAVVIAGLSAEATWQSVQAIGGRRGRRPAEVLLSASGTAPKYLVISPNGITVKKNQ